MYLVTGATGFLGSRITRMLRARGHAVRACGHPADPGDLLEGLGCEIARFDLGDAAAASEALRGISVVFHVAALVTFRPDLYERQMQVNLEGTRSILEACRARRVRRVVYTSTVNTLGIPAAGRVGDESTSFNWASWHLGYMDSKHAAERLVLHEAARGLDAVCVLPVTMFGPGDIRFNAGTYIRESARGRAVLAPPGGTTVAHVDDVARGHLLALERGRAGSRYILGGECVSYRTLLTWIAEELGVRPPRGTLAGPVLRWAGRQADRLRTLLGWEIPFSEGMAVAACSHLYYSDALARSELGYRARPAREAVREAVLWYRAQGLLP